MPATQAESSAAAARDIATSKEEEEEETDEEYDEVVTPSENSMVGILPGASLQAKGIPPIGCYESIIDFSA